MRQWLANTLRRLADRIEPKPDMYETMMSRTMKATADKAFDVPNDEGEWIMADKNQYMIWASVHGSIYRINNKGKLISE